MPMLTALSNKIRHFFHVVSNVRPIFWICLYIGLVPIFALFYHWLPDHQFRIPDGAPVDYGSWLYYSIVTITTLGFGDYTPCMGWAQAITAIEVMCGLVIIGFFLNAVGSMKSEIDVESEIEKQRILHNSQEKDKLTKSVPIVIHCLNHFIDYCTMAIAHEDKSKLSAPAVRKLLRETTRAALCLDSLQTRVDLTQWPQMLEDCFMFVAEYQMFTTSDTYLEHLEGEPSSPHLDLSEFIDKMVSLAKSLETEITTATVQQ